MNNKLLLVKAITLLYRESQIPGNHENSATLVREIVSNIRLPELSVGIDHERDILNGLKQTALSMCESPIGHQYMLADILQRLKIDTMEEEVLYDALCDGIVPELPEGALKRTCLDIKRTLTNHFQEEKIGEIMNKAASTLKFSRNKITDMKAFVAEVVSQLEPYQVDLIRKDPAIISDVDVSNLAETTEVFDGIKDDETGVSIMSTGYQGLNRMLDGGFRRGEQWVIGALQHNYKTGFTLSIFKQIALYNKPQMIDATKKPLLLRISFEDTAALNFQFLYASLKENETGLKVDTSGITSEEMARYVHEKLGVNGYHVRIMHVNPSMWTYRDICNKILELEADGFEVHMCMVDYLLKLPTTGCEQGPAGTDIRNLYERLYNFMKARKITFITPHQLSTDAKMMIRDGRQGFVRELVGRGYYAGCKQIDQVVDGEIFMHIEIVNNASWLTLQRGKHRKNGQTPTEYLYCVLPFYDVGGIRDDVGKADSTRKKVGGGPIGSGEETPFWDLDG